MNTITRLAICGVLCAAAFAEDQPRRIKLATLLPRGSSAYDALLAMGEKWRSASGGKLHLTVYPDGTMGGEAETVQRMRVGEIQAALLSVAGLAQIDPSVTALQYMPMMFRSLEEVDYVRDRLRPMLDKRLAEKGFVSLFGGDAGWVRLFSKRPVIHPEDLKRLKMFALASDIRQIDLMKAAGYQPMALEYTDTLTALQTGMIEAVPTIPFYALAGEFYKPAPYMLEMNYVPLVGGLVVARKTWDALPAMTREGMQLAAVETGKTIRDQSRKESDQAVVAMKARGLKVTLLTPETEKEWRAHFEGLYPRIRGDTVPADVFDEVQRLLREYRK